MNDLHKEPERDDAEEGKGGDFWKETKGPSIAAVLIFQFFK